MEILAQGELSSISIITRFLRDEQDSFLLDTENGHVTQAQPTRELFLLGNETGPGTAK